MEYEFQRGGNVMLRLEKVATFDIVVNCADLMRDEGANTMSGVHAEGACRLFRRCVKRLIHVSALAATAEGETGYQRSKAAAEDFLASLDPDGERLDWRVLSPPSLSGAAAPAWLLAAAVLPPCRRTTAPADLSFSASRLR